MTSKSYHVSPGALMGVALVMMGAITLGHYMTDAHDVTFHNVYRRLYYVPVVLAAFAYGLRGGLGVAVAASMAYVPHAFLMSHHQDPAPALDKVFEILLYLSVGVLTGWLVERERGSRKELERALVQQKELERALVRSGKLSAMGQLLAGVAHEVRNPLASIMGSAEALERAVEEGSRGQKLVEIQLREIARLDRVVSRFLAFSRASEPHHTRVVLEEVVTQVIDLTVHQASEGRLHMDASVGKWSVYADEDQVSQVLLNLTLNAIQASNERGYDVVYEAQRKVIAGVPHICLGVRDHGPGVPEELEEVIFDPYFTTRDSGSGLGLSVSSRIMEAHGGFLELERHEQGATFWICLPDVPGAQQHMEVTR